MSSNGAGRISAAIRQGNRPQEDEQPFDSSGNSVLEKLQPDWFILESVRRMENTVIRNEKNEPENILNVWPGVFIRLAIRSGRRSGLPCLRSSPSPFAVDHHRLPDSFPRPGHGPVQSVYSKELSFFHPPPTHGSAGKPFSSVCVRQSETFKLGCRDRLVDPKDPYHCIPIGMKSSTFG